MCCVSWRFHRPGAAREPRLARSDCVERDMDNSTDGRFDTMPKCGHTQAVARNNVYQVTRL